MVSQHRAGPEQIRPGTLSPLAHPTPPLCLSTGCACLVAVRMHAARGRAQHHGQWRQGRGWRGVGGRERRRNRGPSPRPGRVPRRPSAATATSPGSALHALLVLSPQVLLGNRIPSWRLLGRMRSRRQAHPHAALRAPLLLGPQPALFLAWTCHPPGIPCAILPGPGHGHGASTTTARLLAAPR